MRIIRECLRCNLQFTIPPSKAKEGKGKYCSLTCYKGPRGDQEERFMRQVYKEPTYQCWLWQGHIGKNGYGRWKPAGRSVSTHRWSYERFIGPIPEGLQIDHICNIKSCVNPEHLQPVTARVNVLKAKKGITSINAAKTHCVNGHPLFGANLRIYVTKDGKKSRVCKSCRQDRSKIQARKRLVRRWEAKGIYLSE